jgi:hypothetical protein
MYCPLLTFDRGSSTMLQVVYVIISLVFGLAGYREGLRFEREYGRSPWGWHPLIWGAIMFLSFFVGLLLIAIAERSGRRAAAKRMPAWP